MLSFVCTFVYLVAVHHVSEAGQCMNPDINIFMLNSLHRELQCCSQVAAAGRQLWGIQYCILLFSVYFFSTCVNRSSSSIHPFLLIHHLIIILSIPLT